MRVTPVQMSGWSGAQSLHAQGGQAVVYSGMIDCFSRTVREEGMKALFKVGFPCALAQPPDPCQHLCSDTSLK